MIKNEFFYDCNYSNEREFQSSLTMIILFLKCNIWNFPQKKILVDKRVIYLWGVPRAKRDDSAKCQLIHAQDIIALVQGNTKCRGFADKEDFACRLRICGIFELPSICSHFFLLVNFFLFFPLHKRKCTRVSVIVYGIAATKKHIEIQKNKEKDIYIIII